MVYNQGFSLSFQEETSKPLHHMYSHSKYVVVPGLDPFGNSMKMNKKASVCDTTLVGHWNILHPMDMANPIVFWRLELEQLQLY